jgi:hypothetical protein
MFHAASNGNTCTSETAISEALAQCNSARKTADQNTRPNFRHRDNRRLKKCQERDWADIDRLFRKNGWSDERDF